MYAATNFDQNYYQFDRYFGNGYRFPKRQWVRTYYGRNFRYDHRHSDAFILMSYNILAQSLLSKHKYLYRRHYEDWLNWSHRLACLQNEILTVRPGILCLQEVQDTHLEEIEYALMALNYTKPLYKKRTGPDSDDGCAIFYNPQLFTLLDYHYVEYHQPNVNTLNRFNVAIIAKFASNQLEDQEFVVATTHLLYNPKRDDVRIAQIQVLLAELDRMSVHSKTQQPLPIILTGDFNCTTKSNSYRLIKDGHINSNNLPRHLGIMDDCQHINVTVHNNRQDTALFNRSKRENSAAESACDKTDGVDLIDITIDKVLEHGVPYNTGALWHYLNLTPTQFTDEIASTYQSKWQLVDYIFYTKYKRRTLGPLGQSPQYSSLQLLANYQLPTIQECQMIGAIPNGFYGSDHYAMASEFVLLNR